MFKKKNKPDITKELAEENQRTKSIFSYTNGTLLTLTIDQIDFYENNPRITKNDKYDEVYVSIKAKGLEGSLSVSQRPDNSDPQKFVLFRGGNTRLAVLKQLYEETQDKKYFEVNALFHTWISESDTIIGHLTENDSRGDYVFIDRALGVRASKLELEKESGDKLSDKKLIKALNDQGYKLSPKDLRRMNYAVDIMHPHCPELLASGIGPRQLDAIKKLHLKAAELSIEIDPARKPEFFEQQFATALQAMEADYLSDREEHAYNYQTLYDVVLKILSNEERITANRLAFFLDNRINAKADQQQAFDPNFVEADDTPVTVEKPDTSASVDKGSKAQTNEVASVTHSETPENSEVEVETEPTNDAELASEHYEEPPLAARTPVEHHPTSLDYAVSQDANKHLEAIDDDFTADLDFNHFSDIPVSVSDRRELAPLPDDIHTLRMIMHKKAVLFHRYLKVPGEVTELRGDGLGFIIANIPSLQEFSEIDHVADPEDKDPNIKFMTKHAIGFWILFGLSNVAMIGHKTARADMLKTIIPAGSTYDFFMRHKVFNEHWSFPNEHEIPFFLSSDVYTYFVGLAKPKELQLFIELLIIHNKIFRMTNEDVWGLRGYKK